MTSAHLAHYFKKITITIFGVLIIGYLMMILLSYSPSDPSWSHVGAQSVSNMGGVLGAVLSDLLYTFFGQSIWLFLIVIFYETLLVWWRRLRIASLRVVAYLFLLFATSAFLAMKSTLGYQLMDSTTGNLYVPLSIAEHMISGGGIIGYELAIRLNLMLTQIWTWVFLSVFIVTTMSFAFDFRWGFIFKRLVNVYKNRNNEDKVDAFNVEENLNYILKNEEVTEVEELIIDLSTGQRLSKNQPEIKPEIKETKNFGSSPDKISEDKIPVEVRLEPEINDENENKGFLDKLLNSPGLIEKKFTDSPTLNMLKDIKAGDRLFSRNSKKESEVFEDQENIISDVVDNEVGNSRMIDLQTGTVNSKTDLSNLEGLDVQDPLQRAKDRFAKISRSIDDSDMGSVENYGLHFDYLADSEIENSIKSLDKGAEEITSAWLDLDINGKRLSEQLLADYSDETELKDNLYVSMNTIDEDVISSDVQARKLIIEEHILDNNAEKRIVDEIATLGEKIDQYANISRDQYQELTSEVTKDDDPFRQYDLNGDNKVSEISISTVKQDVETFADIENETVPSYPFSRKDHHSQEESKHSCSIDKVKISEPGHPSMEEIETESIGYIEDLNEPTLSPENQVAKHHQEIENSSIYVNKKEQEQEIGKKEQEASNVDTKTDDQEYEILKENNKRKLIDQYNNIQVGTDSDPKNLKPDYIHELKDIKNINENIQVDIHKTDRESISEDISNQKGLHDSAEVFFHNEEPDYNEVLGNELITQDFIEIENINNRINSIESSLKSDFEDECLQPSYDSSDYTDFPEVLDDNVTNDVEKLPDIHDDDAFVGKSRAFQTAVYRQNLTPIPELDILDKPDPNRKPSYTEEELQQLSELLEIKLQDFNIKAEVINAIPGPVVTRFEVELAPGVKASKVVNISRDLARSLSMASLRVVEVIPGKPYIGIEVPNKKREMVRLIELLDTDKYRDPNAQISMAMGKDIGGKPIITDLAKAPHMLVAGTTGSGKSVLVNCMLLSMLLKYKPDELKLILIDPKQLELANYNDIPHLLTPVVTDMTEAAGALSWCVAEMERRYQLMSLLRVRKLKEFNKKVVEAEESGQPILDPLWRANDSVSLDKAPKLKPLPMIVIVADEFADMIMQVGKQAEELITRLAQKSRAAGIHLMLATQRPSVDVITGLIKANVPVRAALRVNSKVDSRTILDSGGAEDMLGNGDMLFLGPGQIESDRVHGAFVSDEEVNRVCEAWRERGAPEYIENFTENFQLSGSDTASSSSGGTSGEDDSFYNEAVAFILETRKVSASSIQRKFSIGYNRAARIVDSMEEAGIVSPMVKGKREILV